MKQSNVLKKSWLWSRRKAAAGGNRFNHYLTAFNRRMEKLEYWKSGIMGDVGTGELEQQRLIHSLVNTYFTMDEVREMSFLLGIDFDNLIGERKSDRIMSLLIAVKGNGRLGSFYRLLNEKRPGAPWPIFD